EYHICSCFNSLEKLIQSGRLDCTILYNQTIEFKLVPQCFRCLRCVCCSDASVAVLHDIIKWVERSVIEWCLVFQNSLVVWQTSGNSSYAGLFKTCDSSSSLFSWERFCIALTG